jgi:hypothetical protein
MMGEIAAEFRRKLAGLHRRMTPADRAAAARALKDERDAAMRALREWQEVKRKAVNRFHPSPRRGPS